MRTTPDECTELGRRFADRVSASSGRVAVFLPLRGVSAIATEGGPFYDPIATGLVRRDPAGIDRRRVDLVELDTDINDPEFAAAMVSELLEFLLDVPDLNGGRHVRTVAGCQRNADVSCDPSETRSARLPPRRSVRSQP